jgi:hypothetical protein
VWSSLNNLYVTGNGTGSYSLTVYIGSVYIQNTGGATITALTANSFGLSRLDFTGSNVNLNATGSTLWISDTIIFDPAMTVTASPTILYNFSATNGSITTAGKALTNNVSFTVGGGASFTFNDDFTSTAAFLFNPSSSGTLNFNNKRIQVSTFAASSASVRTINMGSSEIILTGSGTSTVWNVNATNLTMNYGTSLIRIEPAVAGATITMAPGLVIYYALEIARNSSNLTSLTFSNSCTFINFIDNKATSSHSLIFAANGSWNMHRFNVMGSPTVTITLNSTTTSVHNLIKQGSGIVNCDYLNLQHSVATPASTWYAGNNSVNNQATLIAGSGWTFTPPNSSKSPLGISGVG